MSGAALRVAMVAGEASGDMLGARVIQALRSACDAPVTVCGIGGEAMQAEGLNSLYPMERLSVMGLAEPLARLPELLRLRRRLLDTFTADPPDLFLGIDAQEFNLGLEERLRRRGVRTAQLVSPTVWAWRPKRVHRVARAVDAVLCLFPFEPPLYEGLDVDASFVGHPLVSELLSAPSRKEARQQLGLPENARIIALLPGSRESEVKQLGAVMLRAGKLLRERDTRRELILPAASAERHGQCEALLQDTGMTEQVRLLRGNSREAMIAADVVVLASGTATLEAMLLARPMVIAYRFSPLTWALMARLAVTSWVGLPNVFAGRSVVPELLQDDLSAPGLALAAEEQLADGHGQVAALAPYREALTVDFDHAVAEALLPLLTRA